MPIPVQTTPPDARTNYIIDQLEGERISIPGSKGVFRILASEQQTGDGMAVFLSAAVLSDAPGFHWHEEAHDVFLVSKGFLKLWNGDKCRIMGPGDFAYIPPKIIHNPEMLGPHTEQFGLISPANWVDFFRYIAEPYEGIIAPAKDPRDLRGLLIPKVIAAKDRFDVHFVQDPNYTPPEVGEWLPEDSELPKEKLTPYYLKANEGPRWMVGGVMSRPFIRAGHVEGRFAISSIESSDVYEKSAFARWFTFPKVDHCFCVLEGLLKIRVKSEGGWDTVREGQTVVISAGETFTLAFASKFVRAILFTSGPGIEEVVHTAGAPCDDVILPDEVADWSEDQFKKACDDLGVLVDSL
ncbi:Cupin domain-containing protein [Scedosporium apiospermum]|uniref:Cupin domain-containing protein n=1 Tax=Pseudallescheria apiosperma TaxID=563466 RepID=A0A084GEM0_PSEDA|nr:Cupin domain-containing protein [Scedosporium apiospermum]KEZ45782.1 Cupin domain-containing protein [Scedosporium apiospermum]